MENRIVCGNKCGKTLYGGMYKNLHEVLEKVKNMPGPEARKLEENLTHCIDGLKNMQLRANLLGETP